ncbi:TIGR04283 family arsenosugar biosynthesis glycosyltransferase [uncultured Croceitalea sp.]|uniref:TIGR04283 family arsenosugar biosynthesis glycosyltransferase n=1 Tax=uncultured Croceitalea sp. TaxID=1798908 RepID=UPI0033058E26
MVSKPSTSISIIIPVLNEALLLGQLLNYLKKNSAGNIKEIIIVDGGSTDNTKQIARKCSAIVLASERGRAKQMNVGAKYAQGELLYFLHADTLPPKDFDQTIVGAHEAGFETGCFRMKFDTKNPVLKSFAWLSRINHTLCRGGDQSLFVTKDLFGHAGGFNEDYLIYEDSEFIRRLYDTTKFKILPQWVTTSARKYRQIGWLRVQFHFAMIHFKNYLGAGPKELYQYYQRYLLQ